MGETMKLLACVLLIVGMMSGQTRQKQLEQMYSHALPMSDADWFLIKQEFKRQGYEVRVVDGKITSVIDLSLKANPDMATWINQHCVVRYSIENKGAGADVIREAGIHCTAGESANGKTTPR